MHGFYIKSNDRLLDCPIIYKDTLHYAHLYIDNAWYNKAHSLIGKPYSVIIARNVFEEINR